jgi:hypothetical protein
MPYHTVRFDRACDEAVKHLGGYEAVDEAIFAYFDALERKPTVS